MGYISLTLADIWFHRYRDGKDIEGRCESWRRYPEKKAYWYFPVDYNSWIESDKALRLASSLSKDTVIVEG